MGNVFSEPHGQQNNQKNMTVNTNISQNQKNDDDLMTSFNMNNDENNEETELPKNVNDNNKYTLPMIEVPSEIPSDQQINNDEENKNNEEGNNDEENKNNEEGNNDEENKNNDEENKNNEERNNDNSTSSERNDQLGGKQRYKKYDLSRLIENLENKIQDGGNVEDSYTFSDNENMEQLKKVILKELDELKKNKVGGSNCDCDNQKGGELYEVDDSSSSSSSSTTLDSDSTSSSSSSDFFAKKSKKHHYEKKEFHHENKKVDKRQNKKVDKRQNKKTENRQNKKPERREKKEESESSKFHFEPSDTTEVSEKLENIETSNSEEGLSIFPFNSSDIKSSISAKNYKMLRRRV